MGLFDKIKAKVSSVFEAVGFDKLVTGLEKTRTALVNKLKKVLGAGRKIDAQLLDELEEILITSDIGVATSAKIIGNVKEIVKRERYENAEQIYDLIKQEILSIFEKAQKDWEPLDYALTGKGTPYSMLIVGVNGVGKTTTIGKLSNNFRNHGKKVIIGAADTFRAAANEQLEIWAQRAGVDIVTQHQGADPAAVAYDTMNAALARNADVVIIDTAGRLHNKANLMTELEKISRVMKKNKADAPNEVLLVLDATTGQNALQQAREFTKVAPLTGLILTKLDGTAKGGIVIAITDELNLPVRFIGVGEKIDDLQLFDPVAYVEALFEQEEETENQ